MHTMPTCTHTHAYTHTHTHTIMHILTQIDDYSLVQFHSLDVSEEDAIGDLLMYIDTSLIPRPSHPSVYPSVKRWGEKAWVQGYIDTTIQYREDLDVRVPRVGTHTHLHSLSFRVIQPRPLVLLPDSLPLYDGSLGMRLPRPLVSFGDSLPLYDGSLGMRLYRGL